MEHTHVHVRTDSGGPDRWDDRPEPSTSRAGTPRTGAAPPHVHSGPVALVAAGTVCGLAWAASLRGWMVQIAGTDSTFDWVMTFGLVLLPGAVVGGLLGWAQHLRLRGELSGARRRWLVASPLVFGVALADPLILQTLITNGQGSGALAVAVVGLCGGHALAGRGPLVARIATGTVALLLTAAGASIGPMGDQPIHGAEAAWVAVNFASLMAVLGLACSIPHRTSARRPERP